MVVMKYILLQRRAVSFTLDRVGELSSGLQQELREAPTAALLPSGRDVPQFQCTGG